jgi:ADP-ribose pyrophosphatase YjhB (NUDIX family)
VYNFCVNRRKQLLSWLWKLIPGYVRGRVILALNARFVVGVGGIILDAEGNLLLARHVYRTSKPWGLPGGMVGYGESLPEALCREIREETGLEAAVGPLVQVGIGERWPNLTFHFLGTVEGTPHPRVNGELFEAGFYPPNALPGPLDPVIEEVIAYALRMHAQPPGALPARTVGPEDLEGEDLVARE